MTVVDVAAGGNAYPVRIAAGLLDRAGELLAPYARGRIAVVSEDDVWRLWGARLAAALGSEGIEALPIVVPAGEASKNWATLGGVLDRLLALGIERSDHIVAFGGGMVGDLAGLAAALLKRGCGLIQIPTTLLAQVDSSVGGKTAVNVAAGKNLVGAFHQPDLVLIDPALLDTLPGRQLAAGYAEVVKYGLIDDADFFRWCEYEGAALLSGDPAARLHAIETSVRAKARIVGADERETTGRRALLNFGHSFAHALEAEAGYSGALLHGEAVAAGMALAMRLSVAEGLCPDEDAMRVAGHLRVMGLPTGIPGQAADRLIAHMRQDKKNKDGRITLILSRGIGQAFVTDQVPEERLRAFLRTECAGETITSPASDWRG
ncbi:3-dehydroquinate synthase [Allosphingosinicella flava]|uniref:3-dehydroquinate synthase n=1 Tax=Allosphingosinicella flava TaxID=2771430 RepID=A0A7T2GLB1_9SPHN|nr:3-dehydroquinate synthase [Sphingosinicella flava]QPQ55965.1 3-dehydroquinate synthase [Sphingosinicella flava]